MIHFDVDIALDPLDLLKNREFNIRDSIINTLDDCPDYYAEEIEEEMKDCYEDFETLYNESYLSFFDYLKIKEEETEFNLEETRDSCNDGHFCNIWYIVPCEFDDERFMEDMHKEAEERESLERE